VTSAFATAPGVSHNSLQDASQHWRGVMAGAWSGMMVAAEGASVCGVEQGDMFVNWRIVNMREARSQYTKRNTIKNGASSPVLTTTGIESLRQYQ
jgi:hypothetical protein